MHTPTCIPSCGDVTKNVHINMRKSNVLRAVPLVTLSGDAKQLLHFLQAWLHVPTCIPACGNVTKNLHVRMRNCNILCAVPQVEKTRGDAKKIVAFPQAGMHVLICIPACGSASGHVRFRSLDEAELHQTFGSSASRNCTFLAADPQAEVQADLCSTASRYCTKYGPKK